MATAIYNAELYTQQSRRIQDLASLQQATAAAPTDDLAAYSEAVYSTLTQHVARLLEADICGVLLYDERRQALLAEQPFYGLAPFVARSYSIPAAPDSPGRAIWQADDVWLANDLADEPLAEALDLGLLINTVGVYNTLLLPLHAGTRRIGLLQVCNKHGRANFTQQDAQNLRLLGAQVAVVVEDIRLTRTEQRRETEMVGLQAISQAFGAIAHEDEFFASANERVAELMAISTSGILLYDEAQQRLVAQLPFYGLPDEVVRHYGIDLPPGSVMHDLWTTEDYWYTNHALTDKYVINAGLAELAGAIGIQKTLLAVLSTGGRRIGIIQVSNKTSGDDFTERDARLLLIFAAQIAAMIDNARLFRETQRRAEEAELLRSIAEDAGRILSSEDSFKPILEYIARLLRAEAAFINLLDRQTGNLCTLPHYTYGLDLKEPVIHNAYAKNFEHSVTIARRPFFSNDVPNDRRVLDSYRAASVQLGIRKALLTPLTVGETSLGEIGVSNRPDDFSADDLRLLNVAAIQIAAALDRIHLYEESGENLRRRLGELDAIQRVSNEVAHTLDIDRVLEVIRSEAIRATESTISTLPLLLPPDEWPAPDQPLVSRRLGDKRPLHKLAEIERAAIQQANTAVLVADYANSPLVPHLQSAQSAVAVAFTHEDQPIGVIHLAHQQAGHFDQRAATFLETLAAKASLSYGSNLRFQDNLDRSERLRRRVEQLNQIFELSQMLQASVDPVTMLEAIAYSVQQSCGFDTIVMTLADPAAGVLRRVAQAGMPVERFELTKNDTLSLDTVRALFTQSEFHLSESLLLPFEQIAQWMTAGMEALATTFDAQRSLDAPTRRDDWRDGDMLLVPIPGSRGDFLGVMSLDRPFDGKRPDRQAVEVVEIFAHQAGSIIENTRTYTASQRQAEQEARLNELMEAIAATFDIDQIIESVARGALRVLPFTRLTLALIDADRRGFDVVTVGVQPDETLKLTHQHRATLEQTALGRTYAEGVDHLYSLTPEIAEQYNDLSLNYADGERTSLVVPLITGGLPLGALHFGSDLSSADGFEEFRPLIKRIANLSAVAFGNANLFADAQTRTQRLALLNNVAIMLSQSLDTENIFETAVREIAVLLALPQAGGYIFDRGEASGVARLIVEYPRGETPPETVIDLNSRAAFRKLAYVAPPEPIFVPDVAALAPDDPIRRDMEAAGQVTYLLIPMVVLSTLATIIASQAVISGAFSLTKQAMQLGYSPRLHTVHTSEREIGQIYVPAINWLLLFAVIALVLGFRSSSALASAYGIAVTLTMMIDTILAFIVVRALWKWGWAQAGAFLALFLLVDAAFFSANSVKILDGGWFPLVLGVAIYTLLSTWKRGRHLLYEKLKQDSMPLDAFISSLAYGGPYRCEGTGIFMTTNPDGVPRAMLHNLLHNKVLHERVVLLNVVIEDVPSVPEIDRVEVRALPQGFYQLLVRYGFKDEPDIPYAMAMCVTQGLVFDMMQTSFFLGKETIVAHRKPAMPLWREWLFAWMFRNAGSATEFFKIPTNRVVELGTQIEM